ncbi:MAG: TolC family protein, partial [Candidatus Sulfotelmatobacter sp.]
MKILERKSANEMIRLCAAALLLSLSGCVVGPKYHPPSPPQPPAPQYKESPTQSQDPGLWTPAQPADAKLRGKWWEIFDDPELNALEEQLDINNQNIKQYFENFMEARAVVREARAQYFPTLTTAPSFNRSRTSGNLNTAPVNTSGTGTAAKQLQSTVYTLPLEASWEPDLWGKVRNMVRQAQYAAQVSAADLESERLTEQASLAEYFFEIRGQDHLQQIYDDTVAADQKAYDLTRALYESGIEDQISVVEAETTLQSAQAGATNVGIARAQYEHAIAV